MSRKNGHAVEIRREEVAPTVPPITTASFVGAQGSGEFKYRISNVQLSENVAKSGYIIRNVSYPNARALFPFNPEHQTIERYFPVAEGGPLYVDNADTPEEITACEKKRETMKELGRRYVVLKHDTDLFAVMEQLGVN